VAITHALILGATGAIGREVILKLVNRGISVTAHGRNSRKLQALYDDAHATTWQGDLSSVADQDSLIARIEETSQPFDALISCSGIVRYEQVGAISERALLDQMQINFIVPSLVSQAVSKRLIAARRGGSILHIASSVVKRSVPQTLGYSASKAALMASVRTMALELAPHQIRVNTLLPGLLDTEMTRVPRLNEGEAWPTGEALRARLEEQFEAGRRAHPLGRLGAPEEVAETALHILTSEWMTGSAVSLDGGATL
jgi:NAD(P)-dependent dehydrogenase (short-subunit alcohol dehydrogenase family)